MLHLGHVYFENVLLQLLRVGRVQYSNGGAMINGKLLTHIPQTGLSSPTVLVLFARAFDLLKGRIISRFMKYQLVGVRLVVVRIVGANKDARPSRRALNPD